MSAIDRLLATAQAEIGYLEKASNAQLDEKPANPGKNNWTKYARDLDGLGHIYNGKKNGYDWCDVFVDWCFVSTFGVEAGMKMLNQSYDGLGAGVKYSAQYHRNAGQFFESGPKPGDQIFFGDDSSWWHTGIVTEVRNGRVYTIEGNTSGKVNVVANGGCVAQKSYPIYHKNIKGYGRPDYSIVEEEDEVTQEQFNQMMSVWLMQQTQKPDAQWGAEWDEAREWAESVGIIKGDENGNKQYQSYTTRQAMVLFLYRLTNLLKGGEN
jgi:hypothetical protein